jgi:hypothetical protein
VKPKLGVVYHYEDEEALWDAVRKEYNGPFVVARDLMLINIGETITWEREPAAAHAPRDNTIEH